jgi:hypothetical protein
MEPHPAAKRQIPLGEIRLTSIICPIAQIKGFLGAILGVSQKPGRPLAS